MEKNYNEDSIQTLDALTHIRLRSGMYIGRLGDGSHADDGIYILLKEIVDNSVDEFIMDHGKVIEINVDTSTHLQFTLSLKIKSVAMKKLAPSKLSQRSFIH